MERRRKEREKEIDGDNRDRRREREELEEIKRKLLEEGHDNVEEEMEKVMNWTRCEKTSLCVLKLK